MPVYGFLILGGRYPIVVDTRYRDNAIMESLCMRGLQFHENMIENQLRQLMEPRGGPCHRTKRAACRSTRRAVP